MEEGKDVGAGIRSKARVGVEDVKRTCSWRSGDAETAAVHVALDAVEALHHGKITWHYLAMDSAVDIIGYSPRRSCM